MAVRRIFSTILSESSDITNYNLQSRPVEGIFLVRPDVNLASDDVSCFTKEKSFKIIMNCVTLTPLKTAAMSINRLILFEISSAAQFSYLCHGFAKLVQYIGVCSPWPDISPSWERRDIYVLTSLTHINFDALIYIHAGF